MVYLKLEEIWFQKDEATIRFTNKTIPLFKKMVELFQLMVLSIGHEGEVI